MSAALQDESNRPDAGGGGGGGLHPPPLAISADLGLPQGEKPPEVDENADFKHELR